jgi:uncharacterized protein (TIGR03067 family)
LRLTWLVVGFASVLIAADSAKGEPKKDLDQMQGSWVVASGESGGNAIADEQAKATRFVIKGDKYIYTIPDYREEGTLKLDQDKKPKAIDVKIVEGRDQGEVQLGIYELAKDTLKLCFAPPGKDNKRPKNFSSNADNDQLLLVLKREKS